MTLVKEQASSQLLLLKPGLLENNVTHLKALLAFFPQPMGAMLRFMLLSTWKRL